MITCLITEAMRDGFCEAQVISETHLDDEMSVFSSFFFSIKRTLLFSKHTPHCVLVNTLYYHIQEIVFLIFFMKTVVRRFFLLIQRFSSIHSICVQFSFW